MPILTQNRKIALAAVMLFVLSFMGMLFYLENASMEFDHGQTAVMHATEATGELSAEDKYRSYFDNKENPVFTVNIEGKIVFASTDFCELLSIQCGGIIDNKIFDFVNSKDLPDLVSVYTRLIQQKEKQNGLGPYRMLQNDREILILFDVYPVLDNHEEIQEIVFSAKDLTEQVEELNENGNGENPADEAKDEDTDTQNWIYQIYPKIREMQKDQDVKMLVDKIGFKQ